MSSTSCSSVLRRTVIFDFDGVLTDTLPEMLRFSDQVCAELGYQRTTTPEDIRGLPYMSFDQLARRLRIAEPLIPQYVQKILQRFDESPITFSPVEGMEEVIRELSTDSVLAIVSGNLRGVIRRFLERYHLAQYFWRIEGIDQVGSKREKIRAIREEVSLSLPTYVVGDAVSDVLAAREAGAISVAVTWGHQALEKLRQAQPDFLVGSPRELIQILRSAPPSRSR